MKRLTLLAVALTMVLGMAASAFAAPEVTVSGNILTNAVWRDNWNFDDGDADSQEQEMRLQQRIDLGFTAVANENLKAVIVFRTLREEWGQNGLADGAGGAAGGGGGNITLGLNQGYIDFNWPDTSVNVKVGFQPVALPAAVGGGSYIQDDHATAVLASTAFNDNVSLLAGWIRFADQGNATDGAGNDTLDDSALDGWVVALPLSYEGFSMSPFFVYTDLGGNSYGTAATVNGLTASGSTAGVDEGDNAYWLGTSAEVSILDPFIIKGDLNYGVVNADDESGDRSGWLFDIALEYTGFDFMNLELAYAYTSGDDDDTGDGSERMPIMVDSWALGTTWFGGGLITGDDMDNNNRTLGFHAVALSATGIQSFVEGLSHDAHIVYAVGNNDENLAAVAGHYDYGRTLMEDDSMLEIDFNSFYKIYDELTLYNGIGYVNLDTDAETWAANEDGGDAWKFQVGLKYVF